MSPQDKKLADELFLTSVGSADAIIQDREPQTTLDGYDYALLLMHFSDVAQSVTVPPTPGFFFAPGNSCTLSVH